MYNFNPRSHEGSDYIHRTGDCSRRNFNPRSHEGSDRFWHVHKIQIYKFQSALPRGERPNIADKHLVISLFQSALPRGERRNFQFVMIRHKRISIRAPTRGATCISHRDSAVHIISIRAPTRGATVYGGVVCITYIFQSALPRGERHPVLAGCVALLGISIRAPTRGATSSPCWVRCPPGHFNPRSHEGSDDLPLLYKLIDELFQSALPRGERLSLHQNVRICQGISIRAPTRGATLTH